MPGPNYFDGGAHLTRGHASDGGPTLAELLAVGGRTRLVDGFTSIEAAHQDGSRGAPYSSIQTAVDDIVASTSADDWRTVLVMPGTYRETLEIRDDALVLFALGGFQSVKVWPTAGVPLVVTNATAASVAEFHSSDDYADLVPIGSLGVADLLISGFSFVPWDGTSNGLECLGVKGDAGGGNTTNFLDGLAGPTYTGMIMSDCYVPASSLFRNCGRISSWRSELWNGEAYNCCDLRPQFSLWNDWVFDYDLASPYGRAERALNGVWPNISTFDDLTLSGSMKFGDPAGHYGAGCEYGVVELQGTANMLARSCAINGNFIAAAAATATFRAVHIQGNISLADGAGAVVMDGGRYMGTLTDPGNRLTHTQGNIGT